MGEVWSRERVGVGRGVGAGGVGEGEGFNLKGGGAEVQLKLFRGAIKHVLKGNSEGYLI